MRCSLVQIRDQPFLAFVAPLSMGNVRNHLMLCDEVSRSARRTWRECASGLSLVIARLQSPFPAHMKMYSSPSSYSFTEVVLIAREVSICLSS